MNNVHDEKMMRLALHEAEKAYKAGEVPIGCVITHGDKIIGRAYNMREALNDPTAHAEMIAITQAGEAMGHDAHIRRSGAGRQ